MNAVVQDKPDLIERLDRSVWHPQFEKFFESWCRASGSDKMGFLLAGPVLSWAESWMLTHPTELTPLQKHFILRSLTTESRKISVVRETFEKVQVDREARYRWLINIMAAFALVFTLPPIMRGWLEHADAPVVEVGVLPPELSETLPSSEVGSPFGGPVGTGPILMATVRQTALDAMEAARLANTQFGVDAEQTALRLSLLSQSLLAQGKKRASMLVALEMAHLMRAAEDEAAVIEAASNVYSAARNETPLGKAANHWLGGGSAAFCSGAKRTMSIPGPTAIGIFDNAMSQPITSISRANGSLQLESVANDCSRIVVVSEDYEPEVLSLSTGKSLLKLEAHETDLVSAVFSADGTKIVTLSRDSVGKIWDAVSGQKLSSFNGSEAMLTGAVFSPDGSIVLAWSEERTAHLWDARSGHAIGKLVGHLSSLTSAIFSGDGRLVLTTSMDGLVNVWDVATTSLKHTLHSKAAPLLSAVFSPNGRHIAARTDDGALQIWDAQTGEMKSELRTPDQEVRAFAFNRDGTLVVIANWNGPVELWRADTGARVAMLNRADDNVADVVFSSDGTTIQAIAMSGRLLSWPLLASVDAVMEYAFKTAVQCLAVDERTAMGLSPNQPTWCTAK
jgi:hypothetical protein